MAKKDSDKPETDPLEKETEALAGAEEVVSDVDFDEEELEDDEHEDAPAPLSKRILQVLSILVIGAVGALWAGPKLAPMLPEGLKPVAEFLAPQADMNAKIAGLRAELESRIAKAETAGNKAEVLAKIRPEIEGLKTRNADLAAKVASVSKTAKTLQDSLTELQTEITNITARQALTSQNGQVSEGALKQLEAKLTAIASAQERLNKSQNLAVKAQQDAKAKLRMADATEALGQISNALKAGAPFQKAMDRFVAVSGINPPAAVSDIASTGTPALSTLKKQFPELARRALRKDEAVNADTSTVAKFTAFLKSQIGTRSLDAQQGDSLDAVLSRIEAALQTGDLQTAVAETTSLSAPAKQTMGQWITSLTQLNAASNAVRTLQQHLTTTLN